MSCESYALFSEICGDEGQIVEKGQIVCHLWEKRLLPAAFSRD